MQAAVTLDLDLSAAEATLLAPFLRASSALEWVRVSRGPWLNVPRLRAVQLGDAVHWSSLCAVGSEHALWQSSSWLRSFFPWQTPMAELAGSLCHEPSSLAELVLVAGVLGQLDPAGAGAAPIGNWGRTVGTGRRALEA